MYAVCQNRFYNTDSTFYTYSTRGGTGLVTIRSIKTAMKRKMETGCIIQNDLQFVRTRSGRFIAYGTKIDFTRHGISPLIEPRVL